MFDWKGLQGKQHDAALLPWWFLMIPFDPEAILRLSRLWGQSVEMQEAFELHPLVGRFIQWRRPELKRFVKEEVEILCNVREYLSRLGLSSTVDQINHIESAFTRGLNFKRYTEMLEVMHDRLQDDLKRGQYFMVPPEKTHHFLSAAKYFGDSVNTAFPSAQNDIEDATKCYAFGRNAASVFHLMRIMEVGLRTLGKSLNNPNLDPERNPSWENILRKCDDELRLPLKDRSAEWKTDDQFYSDATANLRAVKNAWRNPTMHVRASYDDEQALDVMNAVKGFMRHLATKLHD
jgi:hypothetical protein